MDLLKELSTDNDLEVTLLGTVDMTIECMAHFTKRLNSKGHFYSTQAIIGGHPDYAKPDRTCYATVTIDEVTVSRGKQIGMITLQLIPDDKTLFRTSHPKEWDSSFKYFLEALFAEFERLGFIKKEQTTTAEDLSPETLVAKADWRDIENKFGVTKRSFGKKINFVSDNFRREILFRDVEQAFVLASSGYSKPAVILAGGVIEELLRLYLEHKQIKPIKDDFNGYIQTCEQHGLLKDSVSRLSHSLRQFRNLVHLSAEETKKHTLSKSTAIGAVSSIFTIANDF
jgi:hypothetical protein